MKYVILLTDGGDTTDHPDADFVALLQAAAANDIHYLSIALGPYADLLSLMTFESLTNGKTYSSPTASELGGIYGIICSYASTQVKARNIVLSEKVSDGTTGTPAVSVVHGSLHSDIQGITPAQIAQFETSGGMLANAGTLGTGEGRFLTFQVTSYCLTPDSPNASVLVDVDSPSSTVDFLWGLSHVSQRLPSRQFICKRPGGDPRVTKEFDSTTNTLRLSVESRYVPGATPTANIIRDITVKERPSIYFQPDVGSISPAPAAVIGGSSADLIVWKIPELLPQETKLLTVRLIPTVCSADYHPPIDINAQKNTGVEGEISFVRPNGQRGKTTLPPLFGALTVVDTCPGRPDLFLVPNQTSTEYAHHSDAIVAPARVLPEDESPSFWVDSSYNGIWDGLTEQIGQTITGASVRPGLTSLARRVSVPGQGDAFKKSTTNRLYVRIINTGSVRASKYSAQLFIYSDTGDWHLIQTQKGVSVDPEAYELIQFVLPTNALSENQVSPYRLGGMDILRVIAAANAQLSQFLYQWLDSHPPSIRTQLLQRSPVTPSEFDAAVAAAAGPNSVIAKEVHRFVALHGSTLAWGKPSARFRVVLTGESSEKHTNNNATEEQVIVQP